MIISFMAVGIISEDEDSQEEATSTTTVEVKKDVLESAQFELDKINIELDIEEASLVSEIEAKQARLEQVRKIRESF